jgi:hypothetical protein
MIINNNINLYHYYYYTLTFPISYTPIHRVLCGGLNTILIMDMEYGYHLCYYYAIDYRLFLAG